MLQLQLHFDDSNLIELVGNMMPVSSLTEGGRVALAAKQATSASLGLKLAVGIEVFQAGLWRVYLKHDTYQAANLARPHTMAEHEEVISETAAVMAPVSPHLDLWQAQQHLCGMLSEAITYLACQQGCTAPMAAAARALQHVISTMDNCVHKHISQQFDSVLRALSSLTPFSRCAAHKNDSCEPLAERELFSTASVIMRTEPALQVTSWRQGQTTGNADVTLSDRLCNRSPLEDSLPLLQSK